MILRKYNYYSVATLVNYDFKKIGYSPSKFLYNRLRKIRSDKEETFMRYYGEYNFRTKYIAKIALFPIGEIKTKPSMNFSQDIVIIQ